MYTQTDLVVRVIIAVCITILALNIVFRTMSELEIEKIKKESYDKGFKDGQKEIPTRSVLMTSEKMNIHKCEHEVEIGVNNLRMITEEDANKYICEELMKQLTKNLIPFMQIRTIFEPVDMIYKVRGRVMFIKPDEVDCDSVQDGLRNIYSRMR